MQKNKSDNLKVIKTITKRQILLVALFSFILGTTIFVFSYLSMNNHIWLDYFNQPILNWMLKNRTEELTTFAKIITSLAGLLSITAIVSIISISFLYIRREVWRPILLVSSIIISSITSLLLKSLIMDSRPAQIDMIPAFETDYSFPSGHTITIAVFLLVLGYVLYSRNYSKTKLLIWLGIATFGTTLIALTRLYLGYHWLTDVTASFGLGFVVFSIVLLIDYKYREKFKS